ncbi:hypothetical protein Tco_0853724 [Tanacetum coccineum]
MISKCRGWKFMLQRVEILKEQKQIASKYACIALGCLLWALIRIMSFLSTGITNPLTFGYVRNRLPPKFEASKAVTFPSYFLGNPSDEDFHKFLSGVWYNSTKDRALSVKVPVANVTLFSSAQLLRENTDSVRSNQRMRNFSRSGVPDVITTRALALMQLVLSELRKCHH